MKFHKLKSIFEYGCGSAPNFIAVKGKLNSFYYYGYDISKKAMLNNKIIAELENRRERERKYFLE